MGNHSFVRIVIIVIATNFFNLACGIPTNHNAENGHIVRQRLLFKQADNLLKQHKFAAFRRIKPKLHDYILYPHLEYEYYKLNISTLRTKDYLNFAKNYPDFPYLNNLRNLWLHKLAEQQSWEDFIHIYEPTNSIELQCHHLHAKLSTRNLSKKLSPKDPLIEQISNLWLHGNSRPSSCDPLFNKWQNISPISRALLWQRIKLALKADNCQLASYLSKNLDSREQNIVQLWVNVHNDPFLILHDKLFKVKHPAVREIIVHGIVRIAKSNPAKAVRIWKDLSPTYDFYDHHSGYIMRAIGLSMADKHHPQAQKWLQKVPEMFTNAAVYEWRIRSALLNKDWKAVLENCHALPKQLAEKEEWIYWEARALEHMNRKQHAQTILASLAQNRSYYGFLASLRLTKPYALHNNALQVKAVHITKVRELPGVRRALELEKLGLSTKAQAEWQHALKSLNEVEHQAAAKIASAHKLPNWSILALSKAQNKDDLGLRFPQVHNEHIMRHAHSNKIDPAWIFAVTRQESAFVTTAKSRSGALGLMQMLPSTARMVAKDLKVSLHSKHELLQPHKNIALGSRYLKILLDKFNGNAILATAAYNCGPGRLKKWLPEDQIATDVWIETIPYRETREYVKNVLTYAVIYQELINYQHKRHQIQKYLPLIVSRKKSISPKA